MLDVVVLTDERYVNPQGTDQFIRNIVFEDQLVMTELINKGLAVKKVAWSDPNFDWKSTKYVLFRTTWDYAERFGEFADWLLDVSLKTKLINSYDLISWNLDKHYMGDLARSGVNVVETYFVEPKDERSLQDIYQETGWEKAILKPAISAASKDTFLLNTDNISDHASRFSELIDEEAMMIQPFQENILTQGELSLMMIGETFTHAVRKNAKDGDFRVQDDFGGTVNSHQASDDEIELALHAVRACETLPIYARVDMVRDKSNKPTLMELELIEPEMWFRMHPEAAELLGEEVAKLIS